jgi:hypothetical protein
MRASSNIASCRSGDAKSCILSVRLLHSDCGSTRAPLALVVVDCRPPKKMDCADVADAVSSRILYEHREGCSRRQRSDSGRIAPHPVFAQSSAVFALRKSRPRGARRCCFQLLLGFCIVLFCDNAVAIRLTETALTYSSITPQLIPSRLIHTLLVRQVSAEYGRAGPLEMFSL